MQAQETAPIFTQEVGFPWARPPVARVYLTPRARLRRARSRFLASAFVADVRAGWTRTLVILGAVGAAYAFIVVLRGAYVAAEIVGVAR